MPSNADTFHARVMELLDITQRYCPGFNRKIQVDHKTGKLYGTFYVKEEKHRHELEAELENFDDVLRGSSVFEVLRSEAIEGFVAECGFEDIQRIAITEIAGFLAEARQLQEDDPAYALTIWTDAEQGQWDYQVCLKNGFESALADMQTRTDVYDSARGIERYKYYEYSSFGFYPGNEMRDRLDQVRRASEKNYALYGEKFNNQHCFELMLDAVARALNKSRKSIEEQLLTTKDFVAFPRLYDQDEITEFRAVRKTMSAAEIDSVMAHLFGSLLT